MKLKRNHEPVGYQLSNGQIFKVTSPEGFVIKMRDSFWRHKDETVAEFMAGYAQRTIEFEGNSIRHASAEEFVEDLIRHQHAKVYYEKRYS